MTRYTLLLLQLNNRDIKTGRCRCRERRREGSCYGHSEINGTRLGVKFVETFWIGKNDTMSSRLTFADHESVCAGHALFCQLAHIGQACPYIHALCSIYGETCWKKDLLKQICGGRHDNSLCVRCRLHLSQQGGETDWRFHLREAFYGLFYKYLEAVNLVLILTKDFYFGS